MSAVSRDELRIVNDVEHSAANAPSRARKIVKAGDTIFATVRPSLRRIAQIPPSLDGEIVSTAFCVLRPNRSVIHPDFLYFAMQLDDVTGGIASMETGASYPAVRDTDVLNQAIPLPPLSNQHEIATALNLVRSAVLVQKRCEDAAIGLKRATMRSLFAHGLRGEAQKETEIGQVPESWVLAPCDQIFRLTSGKKRPSSLSDHLNDETSFPVLGGNGVMGFTDEWFLDVSQALIIGRVGEYCGAVHIASGKVWVTDNALYTKEWLNHKADVAFVAAFLEYYDLNRFKRMAGQPLVTQGVINEHRVPLPHIEEQREIVAILDAIDRKIDLHRRRRVVLEQLFKTLLHKLMTGEIRVADLDLSALNGTEGNIDVNEVNA
ncbi:MAG: restriction endonuclease subunit S [Nitrospira sp.]|nr:restriction endonuclease subunit S [Nitrospira sp.]